MNKIYEDILYMERPKSERHAPMSMHDRAAQFSPFAALTGHSAAIDETARLTEEKKILDEEKKEELDLVWKNLESCWREHPKIRITYFITDEKKAGGSYVTKEQKLKKLDVYRGTLIMEDGTTVFYADISSLEVKKKKTAGISEWND